MNKINGKLLPALLLLLFAAFASHAYAEEAKIVDKKKAALEALGKSIESSMNAGNASILNSLFDKNSFVDNILANTGISAQTISSTKKSFNTSFNIGLIFIQNIIAKGGKYKFLRTDITNNKEQLIFRTVLNNGLNYHIMRVKDINGKKRITDIYVLLTGENLSKSIRRTMLPLLMQSEKGTLEKLLTSESDYVKYQADVQKFMRLAKTGMSKEAINAFSKLPMSLQKDKTLLILRLNAGVAIGWDSQEYIEAMKDLQKYYPSDPCIDMILIDLYATQQKFNKMKNCLNNIEKAIGKDAYIDFLRATAFNLEGKQKEALSMADKSIKGEPTLIQPYYVKVKIAIESKDWKLTSKTLTQIENLFPVRMDNIENAPLYADYIKTDEYQLWKTARDAKDKAAASAAVNEAAGTQGNTENNK